MTRRPFLSIDLNRNRKAPLQDQLALALKARILDGTFGAGEALPSTRELANDLGLSRNTVIGACDRLLGEGYLEAVPRSGLFVSTQLQGRSGSSTRRNAPLTPLESAPMESAPLAQRRRSESATRVTLNEPAPFRPCRPDVRLFPLARWNRHRNHAFRKFGSSLLQYQSQCALGMPELRQALAEYLNESRGVKCDWQQVAITSGSQQALYLLSQILIEPNDRVMIEDPGYLGARRAFELRNVKICPMPIDRPVEFSKNPQKRLRLIYTTPSRQFPTGACLPVARRMELLELAHRTQAWLIEDDYDSEFRYRRPPFPSLHSLDLHGRVIYLGTMSKVLSPTLRIGYVVLPPPLIERFEQLKRVVDEQGPLVDQATLALFVSSGDFYSHIRRCRKVYAKRLETFLEEAGRSRLPLDFPHTDGGMNQTGFARNPDIDSVKVSATLSAAGFDVPSIAPFSILKSAPGFLFGFTAFDESTIKRAMPKLARLMVTE